MPVDPAAVPVPDPASPTAPEQPMGDIFAKYNPGQVTDLFAPAYIRGFAPSENAVRAWSAYQHNVTPGMLDELRMPNASQGAQTYSGGNGVYGGPIPLKQQYGDPRGALDPEALRMMAQGGHYDVEARRNAIAARLAANAAAQPAPAPPVTNDPWSKRMSQQEVEPLQLNDNSNGRYIY
jgi:hypothetical protein